MAATTLAQDTVKPPADAQGMSIELAQYMARVVNTPLSRAGIKAARRLTLDNFIVSLWGERQPWTRELCNWSRRIEGSGFAPVRGADWMAHASIAAIAQGTASHGYELDDAHDEALSHAARS